MSIRDIDLVGAVEGNVQADVGRNVKIGQDRRSLDGDIEDTLTGIAAEDFGKAELHFILPVGHVEEIGAPGRGKPALGHVQQRV